MSYKRDQQWETSWLPTVMDCIKCRHILTQSPIEQDQNKVADIMPSLHFVKHDIRIGVRIRRPSYFPKYAHEVTIRGKRDSGSETEFSKIMSGWGDLMFYAFANEATEDEPRFQRWSLVSLHAVRRIVNDKKPVMSLIPNGDGTHFYALNLRKWSMLDGKFIIDCDWK